MMETIVVGVVQVLVKVVVVVLSNRMVVVKKS